MASSRTVAVIPARHASTRFPGKPLALIAGRPMVEHVWRRCQDAGAFDEVLVARSLEEAFRLGADLPGDLVVAGGGEIYTQALPYATHQILTEVHAEPEGDAFYPEFPAAEWVEVRREPGEGCDWVWLERMDPAA